MSKIFDSIKVSDEVIKIVDNIFDKIESDFIKKKNRKSNKSKK
jgi:hypothetical protein